MKYKVSVDKANAYIILQADTDAAVANFVAIGTFDHGVPDQEYGYLGNHVVMQHIRDVCYHAGIQDMGRYRLVDMVGKKFENGFRPFFFSLTADGELAKVTGYPAVGTQLVAISSNTATDPGRLYMRYQLADKAKLEAAEFLVNSKLCRVMAVEVPSADVCVVQVMTPILDFKPGTVYYGQWRPKRL